MTEQAFRTPYICFAGQNAQPGEDIRGPYVRWISQRNDLACRLSPEEDELAQLFDGQRNAAERLQLAQQRFRSSMSARDMDNFSHMLCDAGLLWAGSDEALPVPAQTDAESSRLGQLDYEPEHEHALPPSTSAGSLAGPGLSGPIAGSPMRARDGAERIDWELSPTQPHVLGPRI